MNEPPAQTPYVDPQLLNPGEPPPPLAPAPGASQMSMLAAALGVVGLGLDFLGCCCGLFLIVGIPVGVAGGVLGFLEHSKMRRGEISAQSGPMAIVAMVAGALSLVLGLLFGVLLLVGIGANFMGALKGLMDR